MDENHDYASKGVGTAGLTTGIIGTALGVLAPHVGGIFGGSRNGNGAERELAQKDAEIALLKSEKSTDAKLVEVYNALYRNDKELNAKVDGINARVLAIETAAPLKEQLVDGKIARLADSLTCCCNASNAAITNLQTAIAAITKTVVPKDAICPEVMPRYNSWTAPTATPAANNG